MYIEPVTSVLVCGQSISVTCIRVPTLMLIMITHYVQICTEVNTIRDYRLDDTDAIMGDGPFTVEEIEAIAVEVRKLKLRKRGGNDSLTNEHIKYGGPVLCERLAKLFNAMYVAEYIQQGMIRGLIVTLYKSSRKYEDDRKNYRGISLLPVIAKLFDKVLLTRIKKWLIFEGIEFPSVNQNVYQPNLCSLFASFELQECVNYNNERGSRTYMCLLDSTSAFDTVWHAGLFVKLMIDLV